MQNNDFSLQDAECCFERCVGRKRNAVDTLLDQELCKLGVIAWRLTATFSRMRLAKCCHARRAANADSCDLHHDVVQLVAGFGDTVSRIGEMSVDLAVFEHVDHG